MTEEKLAERLRDLLARRSELDPLEFFERMDELAELNRALETGGTAKSSEVNSPFTKKPKKPE